MPSYGLFFVCVTWSGFWSLIVWFLVVVPYGMVPSWVSLVPYAVSLFGIFIRVPRRVVPKDLLFFVGIPLWMAY